MPTVRKSVINEDEIDTVLESDIEFSGTLETSKTLLIQGKVSGILRCGDDVYIAAEATVHADINAKRLIVRGALEGSIRAESVQLLAGSRVGASLQSPDIVKEDGAVFSGSVVSAAAAAKESDLHA